MTETTPTPVEQAPTRQARGAARVWAVLRQILGWIPLSWRGALTIPLLIWLIITYWYGHSDKMVYVICISGFVLVALMLVLTTAVALWLRFRREPTGDEPWNLTAHEPFLTGYALSLLSYLPLVKLQVRWETPHGVSVALEGRRESVLATERAHVKQVVRRFIVGDSFGLTEIRFDKALAQEVKILPWVGEVQPRRLPLQFASGDALPHPDGKPEGDPIEMRQYAPGDPLKMVLWKLYARTGKLMVRLPERAISPAERTMAYLVAGPDDEPSAGVAYALLEAQVMGDDFYFGADGSSGIANDLDEARERIVRSVHARDDGAAGLDAFLALGQRQGMQSCLLFIPGRVGPWVDRLAAIAAQGRCRFLAVIGTDGPASDAMPSRWRRLLFAPDPQLARTQALRTLCRRLSDLGIEWQAFDRTSGQQLGIEAA